MKTSAVSITLLFTAIFLCAVAIPTRCQAADTDQPKLSNAQTELLLKQKKMKRLKAGMVSQKELIKSSSHKETKLLDELSGIEKKLKNERSKLGDLQKQLAVQEQTLSEKRQTLDELVKARDLARMHVKKRLAAYYRLGKVGLLNAIFSSAGLAELLRFDTYYQSMVKRDNAVLSTYRKEIQDINDTSKAVEQQKTILVTYIAGVATQEKQLAVVRKDRRTLLNRVQTEKELFQSALVEIKQAADNLTSTITELKKEAQEEKRQASIPKKVAVAKMKQFAWPSFAEQKGKLPTPVSGTVTKMFGKSATEKFGLTLQANGITIETQPGTAIRAVYHGKVVYVGQLKGYGNLIIIDHDQQYYSLIARADQYFKKKGDIVMGGEVVGISGENTGLLEEGLHFEIRHGSTPLNPMDWLKPGNLKVAVKN